jgi:hypothetical protein
MSGRLTADRIGVIGLALFGAFTALRLIDLPLYETFTALPDALRKPDPFVDLKAILQAGLCWRHGVNVYTPNACMGGGEYNYAPILLRLAYLYLRPNETIWLGLLQAAAFFASLRLLPAPASAREARLLLACALSIAVFYGIEQGNLDIAIFVLTVLGLRVVLHFGRLRFAGYAFFCAAAAAKFYPAALLVTALRERRRTFIRITLAACCFGVVLIWFDAHGLSHAAAAIPSGTPFRASFGRIDIPRGLYFLHILSAHRLNALLGMNLVNTGVSAVNVVSYAMSIAACGLIILFSLQYRKTINRLDEPRQIFLIAGAATLTFCFFAAQNIIYRAVFLLLTLPGLSTLARTHRRLTPLPAAIVLLMWEAAPRALLAAFAPSWSFTFWALRESLWWWLIIELGAILLAYTLNARARLTGG